MTRTKYPVRYMTKLREKSLGVSLSSFSNAGPNPNVTGMRNRFWGIDAMLVRQGQYVYKIPARIYFLAVKR